MEVLIGICLEENCSGHKKGGICYDGKQLGDIGDLEYGGRGKDVFEFFECFLL